MAAKFKKDIEIYQEIQSDIAKMQRDKLKPRSTKKNKLNIEKGNKFQNKLSSTLLIHYLSEESFDDLKIKKKIKWNVGPYLGYPIQQAKQKRTPVFSTGGESGPNFASMVRFPRKSKFVYCQ